jgi:hypothetical protein
LYFLLEGRIGHEAPQPITHPEFYYGFLGGTFLWQAGFILIAKDPLCYRAIMLLTIADATQTSVDMRYSTDA